jgi:YD repeat-containing protein
MENKWNELNERLICRILEGDRKYAEHGRMARGAHGLPKVLPRPAMPYLSTLCQRVTPETALWPWQSWRPAAVFYPFGHPTAYTYDAEAQLEEMRRKRGKSTIVFQGQAHSYCTPRVRLVQEWPPAGQH